MGITTTRIAYKIGFSSAMNEDTISAYMELVKWEFVGDSIEIRAMVRAFGIGYRDATKWLQQVKYQLKTAAQNG